MVEGFVVAIQSINRIRPDNFHLIPGLSRNV